jgi:hypothetical protein
MELDYALLADSAQVSQGKTFILGGGISILRRPAFPAPLGVSLVLQLTYERAEIEEPHRLRVLVMDADGNLILPELVAEMQFRPPDEDLPRGVPLVAPIALAFPPLPVLQRPGSYQVQVLLDGRHIKTLPLAVVRVEHPG